MLAGCQGIERDLRVPIVDGRDQHGINVFALEKLSMIAVAIGLGQPQKIPGRIEPFLPEIADRDLSDIIFLCMSFLVVQMGGALVAHADVTDIYSVVCSNGSSR